MPVTTGAILGGINSAVGIGQYLSGRKKAKENSKPEYEIPSEIKDNLSQAQLQALQGLPEAQKNQYIQNVQRTQNQGLNALGDRKSGIAGLASLTQAGNDANTNLLSMDAQARQQNQSGLMNARTQMSGYKDKDFELNKLLPFQQQAQAAQGLQGAGLQNIVGGLNSMQNTFENASLAKAYGTQGATNPVPPIPPITPATPPVLQTGTTQQTPDQAPQRNDIMNQYQIAKLSNPGLTLADFMKTQGGGGLAFPNNIKY